MPTYFKPLRRKIGVMTLIVTCVLMGAWFRSRIVGDYLVIPVSARADQRCFLRCGYFWRESLQFDSDGWAIKAITWDTFPVDDDTRDIAPWDGKDNWVWSLQIDDIGFGHRPRIGNDVSESRAIYISCKVIVIPLTLLSAWLLLSKLRVKSEPKNG